MANDERFQSLYRKYYRRIVRFYVQSFHLSEEDAEDLTQEAFVRFLEAIDEYRGDAEWAFFETIARRVAFNKIRSQKAAKRSANTVDIDDPNFDNEPAAPAQPDYAELEQQAIRQQQMRRAMAELSRGQRECLQLWLAGYKYNEIAKLLKISDDAVKSRIRDAKKILRDRLGNGTGLPEDES
jgi:RNA polymerase sigma-70 factor (ECF subfamily)